MGHNMRYNYANLQMGENYSFDRWFNLYYEDLILGSRKLQWKWAQKESKANRFESKLNERQRKF